MYGYFRQFVCIVLFMSLGVPAGTCIPVVSVCPNHVPTFYLSIEAAKVQRISASMMSHSMIAITLLEP